MQFSDYQHPEWCEEKKFTKVEITGEKQSALTVDTAPNKFVIDGSKAIDQDQFVAFCNYFNNNRDAIKTHTEGWSDATGALTNLLFSSNNVRIGGTIINAASNGSMILFTPLTPATVDITAGYVFAIFNGSQAFKNKTVPAYTWVRIGYNDVITDKPLPETDVEVIDYKLTLDIGQDVVSMQEHFKTRPELVAAVAATYDPLHEGLFNLNVYGIIDGEVKEPVFNFTTNCNLFIDNMR